MSPTQFGAQRRGIGVPMLRAVVVLVLAATVASCSAAVGPTVDRSDTMAAAPESWPSVPAPDPELAPTTSVTEPSEAPRQPTTTVPEADPVVSAPVDLDTLSADVGIERTSLTPEAALGAESSLFSLVTAPNGNALIAGASRDDDMPVATLWAIDPETGAIEEHWVLPSPPGIAATARDVAMLADGSMVVVGVIFASNGSVPVSWRVSPGSSEPPEILPCGCDWAEAERVVVDAEGRLWVVGRDPGWQGAIVVWTSGDEGRSWAGPHTELTGEDQTVLAAPLDRGVAVVNWSSYDRPDSAKGWTSYVFVMDGDKIHLSGSVTLSLASDEIAVDLTRIDDQLWMATSGPTHVSLWSSFDGASWDATPVPIESLAADPYVVPIAVEPVSGGVGLVMHHGDSIDDQLTVIVFDGAGFETWPTTIKAPTYWGRYVDAWPVAGYADGVLVLDPGWIARPSLVRLDRDRAEVLEMAEIPPNRRAERERVWALTAGTEAVVATIYRQYTTGPEQWVNETPRLTIGSGDSWTPIEMPTALESVVGVVADGDGFVVASTAPYGTVFVPVSSKGVVASVDDFSVEPFYAQSVISSEGGRLVAHTSDSTAPIWIKEPGRVWEPLPPLPTTSSDIRRVCAGDDMVVAIAVTEPDEVNVLAYTGASWTSIGMMPSSAARDNEDPRCEVTVDSVIVAFRRLISTPDQFASEWWRWDRSDTAAGTFGSFDRQWPDDRITDIVPTSAGYLATGLRGDDEYSYDAVAWTLDGSTRLSPLMLAGGPGIQEARSAVRFGDQLLVGGTDAGAAIIWSFSPDR